MPPAELITETRAMLTTEQSGNRNHDRMFALKALGLALKHYIETGDGDYEFMQWRFAALRDNKEYKLT